MPAGAGIYETVDAFLAGLAASGVRHAVLSPGLRSTPLAVTARRRHDLNTDIVLDERSAAFMALGRAKAQRAPVALICTSGTAGAHYYPAVIEAGLTRVPLVVITADRPPELRGWDAGQTIDQIHLYGRHAKAFTEMPVGELPAIRAERLGFRAGVTAQTGPAGPVHINWPFREPLEPPPAWLAGPATPTAGLSWDPPAGTDIDLTDLVEARHTERGIIVAGPLDATPAAVDGIGRLSAATGWPVLADPLSQLRTHRSEATIVDAADLLLTNGGPRRLHPDVVVRVGANPTSKASRLWLEAARPRVVFLVDPEQRWADAGALATMVITADPARLATVDWGSARPTTWTEIWRSANARARRHLSVALASEPMLELGATAAVAGALPPGSALMVASSMPVRNLDMVLAADDSGVRVFANRGANGIDGTISTAVGIAAASGPTTLIVGDLAFLHDLSGLVTAGQRTELPLTIVVLNNGGGGIFSLLPIGELGDVVDFEGLYRTPQHADLAQAAATFGLEYERVTSPTRLRELVARPDGVRVVEVPVDRDHNVAQIRRLRAVIEEDCS